jgi:hypothetical protein
MFALVTASAFNKPGLQPDESRLGRYWELRTQSLGSSS